MGLFWNKSETALPPPAILASKVAKDIAQTLLDANLTDDAFVKISRQLDFWYSENTLSDEELVALAKRLIDATAVSSCHEDFQCPKVRYGKTEIQIPIITTGGMRVQWTWLPDMKPVQMLLPSDAKILNSP